MATELRLKVRLHPAYVVDVVGDNDGVNEDWTWTATLNGHEVPVEAEFIYHDPDDWKNRDEEGGE